MKTAVRFKLSTVALGVLMACASICQSADTYRLSEITRVLSPVSFECRLQDFMYAPPARVQVLLENASPIEERVPEALAALRQMLQSAETIEVRISKVRNYFRVEAQVLADGRDVAEMLALKNYISRAKPQPVLNSELHASGVRSRPAVSQNETQAPAKTRSGYNLERLTQTKVDLSLLRAETPLVEALQIISDSVQPRLPIVVFWADLENNALVDKDTPIGVEGFGEISAAIGLDAVLYSVSSYGTPVRFTIEGGILKIGTLASLSRKTTKVYSVVDLLAPGSYDTSQNGYGSGGMGSGTGGSYSGAR